MRIVNEPTLPRRHRRKSSIIAEKIEAEMKQAEDKPVGQQDVKMEEFQKSEEEQKAHVTKEPESADNLAVTFKIMTYNLLADKFMPLRGTHLAKNDVTRDSLYRRRRILQELE